MPAIAILAAALVSCIAVDGDTLRCAPPGQGQKRERVRLVGIDAPEMPGHCRPGRHCAPGDPVASKESLRRAVAGKPVQLERFGQDRYGRTLAVARVNGVNLACAQLRAGRAIYRADWDIDGRVGRCR